MKGGEFSLTKCRLPNVDGCTDSRPSPNWLVAEFEYLSSKAPFRSTVSKLHLYGTCKSNFIRLACTKPSCESNNRMRCYKNRAECNDFLNWYKSVKLNRVTIVLYDATFVSASAISKQNKSLKKVSCVMLSTIFVTPAHALERLDLVTFLITTLLSIGMRTNRLMTLVIKTAMTVAT